VNGEVYTEDRLVHIIKHHLIPANELADTEDIAHARDYLAVIVNRENAQFPERQSHINKLVSDIKSLYKKDIIEVDSDSK
jgi:hypothetical protein